MVFQKIFPTNKIVSIKLVETIDRKRPIWVNIKAMAKIINGDIDLRINHILSHTPFLLDNMKHEDGQIKSYRMNYYGHTGQKKRHVTSVDT
jgi:hypothetical protein